MKESFLPLGLAGVFAIALLIVCANLATKKEVPYPATPRLLDCDPDHFAGRIVSLKTDGFEPTQNATDFMYRRQSDKPDIILIRFRTPPDPMPPVIAGRCIGKVGNAVVVDDCRETD